MMYNFPLTADGNTPYVNIPNSTTYIDMCIFVFRGSDIDNVSVAKVIIETGNRAADLRIYDGTNTLFSVTVPASSTRAIFTMTLGTVPASETLVSLQARRSTTTGGQNPKLYSLMMY